MSCLPEIEPTWTLNAERIFLTIAVRSKRSLRTAHFDSFNAEPFMQIGVFRFPALQQETKQEEVSCEPIILYTNNTASLLLYTSCVTS